MDTEGISSLEIQICGSRLKLGTQVLRLKSGDSREGESQVSIPLVLVTQARGDEGKSLLGST